MGRWTEKPKDGRTHGRADRAANRGGRTEGRTEGGMEGRRDEQCGRPPPRPRSTPRLLQRTTIRWTTLMRESPEKPCGFRSACLSRRASTGKRRHSPWILGLLFRDERRLVVALHSTAPHHVCIVAPTGHHAFSECSSLVAVAVPPAVTSLGSQAFYNCAALVAVVRVGAPLAQETPPRTEQRWVHHRGRSFRAVAVAQAFVLDRCRMPWRSFGTSVECGPAADRCRMRWRRPFDLLCCR